MLSSRVTWSTSSLRLTNGPRVNRRSAETAAFSRTVRLIISASVWRSGGMYADFARRSAALYWVPAIVTVPVEALQAGEGAQQLALAVADDAGDADDLAGTRPTARCR